MPPFDDIAKQDAVHFKALEEDIEVIKGVGEERKENTSPGIFAALRAHPRT